MSEKRSWETFFDAHAQQYMENSFTRDTLAEVDFLIEHLHPLQGGAILDIGCGTGRHSIELAKRGYRVTGVDLSAGMLAAAEKSASEAGVTVKWVKADATQFESDAVFDVALSLCEGGISLIGLSDDPFHHDLLILQAMFGALKAGGRALVTAINGMRFIRKYGQEDVEQGTFNPLNLTENYAMEIDTPEGKQSIPVRERGYVPTELRLLFEMAGFKVEHIGGGTAGNWGIRSPELDEMELLVIARKPG